MRATGEALSCPPVLAGQGRAVAALFASCSLPEQCLPWCLGREQMTESAPGRGRGSLGSQALCRGEASWEGREQSRTPPAEEELSAGTCHCCLWRCREQGAQINYGSQWEAPTPQSNAADPPPSTQITGMSPSNVMRSEAIRCGHSRLPTAVPGRHRLNCGLRRGESTLEGPSREGPSA